MSCDKQCGKLCQTPEIERSWTPIKKLNCDDHAYMQNIIEDLERAKRENDIEKVLIFAREYERILLLCGNTQDETVQRFERALGIARDTLGLQSCKILKRSLETGKPKPKRTMHGYEVLELVENTKGEIIGLRIPEKQQQKAVIPDPEPECMLMLRANDIARQEAQKKGSQ